MMEKFFFQRIPFGWHFRCMHCIGLGLAFGWTDDGCMYVSQTHQIKASMNSQLFLNMDLFWRRVLLTVWITYKSLLCLLTSRSLLLLIKGIETMTLLNCAKSWGCYVWEMEVSSSAPWVMHLGLG